MGNQQIRDQIMGVGRENTSSSINNTSRNPLSDCTNTIDDVAPANSSQSSSNPTQNSSSSIVKPSKLLSTTTKTNNTPAKAKSSEAPAQNDENEPNPSAVLVPSASTPPYKTNKNSSSPEVYSVKPLVPSSAMPSRTTRPSSLEGTATHKESEPDSFYNHRKSEDAWKKEMKAVTESGRSFSATKSRFSKLLSTNTNITPTKDKSSHSQAQNAENMSNPSPILVPSSTTPSRTVKPPPLKVNSANLLVDSAAMPSQNRKPSSLEGDSAALLVPSPATPSQAIKPSSLEGSAARKVSECGSVYGRRKSENTRSKRKVVSKPMRSFSAVKTRSTRDDINEAEVARLSKSCTVPCKKKKRQTTPKDLTYNALSKEFIEQQRSYFAEIDAFELEEEEVASADELD